MITANYSLPVGSLQAVRAGFRYKGSASLCTSGDYDERDDLVFAVTTVEDTQDPVVNIDSPADGANVSGVVDLQANATDNVAVARVEFFIDSELVGSDESAPYRYSWNTLDFSNGNHTLAVKAFDAKRELGLR